MRLSVQVIHRFRALILDVLVFERDSIKAIVILDRLDLKMQILGVRLNHLTLTAIIRVFNRCLDTVMNIGAPALA